MDVEEKTDDKTETAKDTVDKKEDKKEDNKIEEEPKKPNIIIMQLYYCQKLNTGIYHLHSQGYLVIAAFQ